MKQKIFIIVLTILLTGGFASAFTLSGSISGGINLGGITYVYAVSNDTASGPAFFIGLALFGNGNYAVLNVPSGNYILFAYQDRDNNLLPSANDYYGFYGDTLPELLAVAGNTGGLNIQIAPLPVTFIQGTVAYTGQDSGMTIIQVSTTPLFEDLAYFSILLDSTGSGDYTVYADSGQYYVRVYMDMDLNFQYSGGIDPMGYYGYPNAPQPINISPGSSVGGIDIEMLDPPSGVENPGVFRPSQFRVFPAFPNPFNSETTIAFNLAKSAETLIELYDIQSRRLAVLAERIFPSGMNTLNIDMKPYASGVYFITLQSGDISSTQKILLIK